jgi:hypothetical protein
MDAEHRLHDSLCLPLIPLMTELTAHAIGAEPVFPKAIAGLLAEAATDLHADELMRTVSEAALPAIGATALFRKILAEFGFMFEGVSLSGYFFFTGRLSATVALRGGA